MKQSTELQGIEKIKFEYSWWAAKRAASSSRRKDATKPKNKEKLIQKLQQVDFEDYGKWHDEACALFNNESNFYGISAKFIAIFMKTHYVINDYDKYKNIIYPPIDSRTLDNLKYRIKWTRMLKRDHENLMSLLSKKYDYLYKIEELWSDSDI